MILPDSSHRNAVESQARKRAVLRGKSGMRNRICSAKKSRTLKKAIQSEIEARITLIQLEKWSI
jgi:hypothetical protein